MLGFLLFIVGVLALIFVAIWLGRGETNDQNRTHGDGGSGSW